MFNVLGIVCQVCKKSIHNQTFMKDRDGDALYFTNPKISEFTDEVHYFCGAVCSTQWHLDQMEARKNPTQ